MRYWHKLTAFTCVLLLTSTAFANCTSCAVMGTASSQHARHAMKHMQNGMDPNMPMAHNLNAANDASSSTAVNASSCCGHDQTARTCNGSFTVITKKSLIPSDSQVPVVVSASYSVSLGIQSVAAKAPPSERRGSSPLQTSLRI